MNKLVIYIILIVCGGLIAYIMLGGLLKNQIKSPAKNPYELDLRKIGQIDPSMIKFIETQRIGLSIPDPKVIDYSRGMLAIGYQDQVQLIDTSGVELFSRQLKGPVTAIAFSTEDLLYVASMNFLQLIDLEGEVQDTWNEISPSSHITSIASKTDRIFVADVSGPTVYYYDRSGKIINSFDGKEQGARKHGFIIPSPHFDLEIDSEGQLWAANTGKQSLENYTEEGTLRSYWGNSSYTLNGFVGCCNPAHFTLLSDDSFVTCEKGLNRIKVHKASGELEGVVATTSDFEQKALVPDLTSDEQDNIYVLDISGNMIRKYKRKES